VSAAGARLWAGDHRFPCEACGSDLRFEPGTRSLVCDHCGNVEAIETVVGTAAPLPELDFGAAVEARLSEIDIEETRTSSCPNCGAIVEFDPDVHARVCPFCATPVVTGTGVHRHIKPGGLAPFEIDETAARAAMADWLGRLWFAPNGLQAYARRGRRLAGIYVPHWTFDARTRTEYSGQRGTVHVERRVVVRDGRRQTVPVTRVRWRPVRGRVARVFDDVLVLAARSLPRQHTEALLPWDLARLVPYTPEYLAGFRAEAYQIELPDAWAEARTAMDRMIARDVRFDIGGDRQQIHRMHTQVSEVTFKHVLLPVWVAAYRFRGESYRFVVNGQTGRVQGERPWSVWKIALAALLAVIVGAALAYLYTLTETA
jgi:hypothetical protein